MISTLTGKNQVTVPAELARQYGLEAGTRFDWTAGDKPGTIVIEILPSTKQLLERARELGKSLAHRDLIQELIDERVAVTVEILDTACVDQVQVGGGILYGQRKDR